MTFSILFTEGYYEKKKETRVIVGSVASRESSVVVPSNECKANKVDGRREWWKFNVRVLGSRNKLNTILHRASA